MFSRIQIAGRREEAPPGFRFEYQPVSAELQAKFPVEIETRLQLPAEALTPSDTKKKEL